MDTMKKDIRLIIVPEEILEDLGIEKVRHFAGTVEKGNIVAVPNDTHQVDVVLELCLRADMNRVKVFTEYGCYAINIKFLHGMDVTILDRTPVEV